jgi:hypothetical protein
VGTYRVRGMWPAIYIYIYTYIYIYIYIIEIENGQDVGWIIFVDVHMDVMTKALVKKSVFDDDANACQ